MWQLLLQSDKYAYELIVVENHENTHIFNLGKRSKVPPQIWPNDGYHLNYF